LKKTELYLDNCCFNRPYDDQQKEPFDYTKWQENLFKDMTIDEIYNNAAELRQKNKK